MISIELGFMYTVLLCQVLMAITFNEVMAHEKSSETARWYFYIFFQFVFVPTSWLSFGILKRADMVPSPQESSQGSLIIYFFFYEYHTEMSALIFGFGIILTSFFLKQSKE